jgi:hypothetical protein
MDAIRLLFERIASVPIIMRPIVRTAIADGMNQGGTSVIGAAIQRNTKLFIVYISVLVVTALLVAFLTWLVWDSGNKVQEAISKDGDARIEEAKLSVKKLENDNLKLSNDLEIEKGKVAVLQADALNARTAQQKAESSLLKLQQRMQLRTLSAKQRTGLQEVLSKNPNKNIKISCVLGDTEGCPFAREIAATFVASGWTLWGDVGQSPFDLVGIFIHFPDLTPEATTVQEAFSSIEMPLTRTATWTLPQSTLEILVGRNPAR